MRTHQHVAGVQCSSQEALSGFGDVDSSQGSLGQGVGRDQGQTVHAHLVDAVNGLEGKDPLSMGSSHTIRPGDTTLDRKSSPRAGAPGLLTELPESLGPQRSGGS